MKPQINYLNCTIQPISETKKDHFCLDMKPEFALFLAIYKAITFGESLRITKDEHVLDVDMKEIRLYDTTKDNLNNRIDTIDLSKYKRFDSPESIDDLQLDIYRVIRQFKPYNLKLCL